MKPTEITIALPTNSRIADDIKPLREALRLEGKQGVSRSPDFKNARFRDIRAQDIARLFALGLMDIGITGRDLMLEKLFEVSTSTAGMVFEVCEICSDKKPAQMSFLGRGGDFYRFIDNSFRPQGSKVVTSYPELTRASVLPGLQRFLGRTLQIQIADGKIESLVSNQDFGPTVGGVDLVRSGKTASEFGLYCFGDKPILESWPTIYRSAVVGPEMNLVADAISFLRKKATEAGFSLSEGSGLHLEKNLQQWKPLSGPVEELT